MRDSLCSFFSFILFSSVFLKDRRSFVQIAAHHSRKETSVGSRAHGALKKKPHRRRRRRLRRRLSNAGLDASSSTDPVESAPEIPGCNFKGPLSARACCLLVGSHGFGQNGNNQSALAGVVFFWPELIPSTHHIGVTLGFLSFFFFKGKFLYS